MRIIETIRRDPHLGTSYRIADERGSCELTVSPEPSSYANGRHVLTSYGGSLWPHDFPDLFESLPDSVQLGSGRVAVIGELPDPANSLHPLELYPDSRSTHVIVAGQCTVGDALTSNQHNILTQYVARTDEKVKLELQELARRILAADPGTNRSDRHEG